jgi:hypothetical protein
LKTDGTARRDFTNVGLKDVFIGTKVYGIDDHGSWNGAAISAPGETSGKTLPSDVCD